MMHTLQKTLLYNLIIFNFILLEASTKKISNFFIEKLVIVGLDKKRLYQRVNTVELLVSFKRFLRSFFFLKEKTPIITVFGTETHILLLKTVLKKYKLTCFFDLSLSKKIWSIGRVKSLLFLEHPINKSKSYAFFVKRNYLFHSIISFIDYFFINTYNIFATLEDQKKLFFLGLVLSSIFKK